MKQNFWGKHYSVCFIVFYLISSRETNKYLSIMLQIHNWYIKVCFPICFFNGMFRRSTVNKHVQYKLSESYKSLIIALNTYFSYRCADNIIGRLNNHQETTTWKLWTNPLRTYEVNAFYKFTLLYLQWLFSHNFQFFKLNLFFLLTL